MDNHLTFWIPGLRPNKQFASELSRIQKSELPNLKHLNLILSRSDRVAVCDIIDNDFILQQLKGDAETNNHWPLALWRMAHEELDLERDSHQWLCADPVYVHPDRAEAVLFAYEELDIGLNEARELVELINQHYQDDPWELHVGSTHRWYIKLQKPFDIKTHVLHTVKGKNIFDFLPSGEDARYWQQCMNELQMLLYSSDINLQREERGLMPINSLWFWGYGEAGNESPLHWQTIYSDDLVLNGLGKLSGSNISALPDGMDDIKEINGEVLIHFQKLQQALQQQDIFSWLDDLQYLEKYWIMPLIKMLETHPRLQVTLLVDDNEAYQFTKKQLNRWWRFNNKNKLL